MESARQAYRQSKKTSLTRIDMLIGLYGTTLKTLDSGVEALQADDIQRFTAEQIKVYRCVVALLEGIAPDHGEVAQNTQRLCMYVAELVQEANAVRWNAAARILQPLHDSFQKIREEAVALEMNGQIPELQFQLSQEQAVL